jgi:hypothetical protein
MSQAQVEMGNKLISVATTEAHPPLGLALRKYGRFVHIAGDMVNAEVECLSASTTYETHGLSSGYG